MLVLPLRLNLLERWHPAWARRSINRARALLICAVRSFIRFGVQDFGTTGNS